MSETSNPPALAGLTLGGMRQLFRLVPLIVTAAAVTALAAPRAQTPAAPTEAWPRWRGAAFDGRATTAGNRLGRPFALRVRWTRSLGAGYSGIAVAGGRAVTLFSDGTRDFLTALTADTGAEEWRVPLGAAFPGKDGSAGGPVSTPAIDEGVAYALGPRGTLAAVRIDTGRTLWTRHIADELGAIEPHWGFTTSPLIAGDLVVILTGGSSNNAVTAFDKRTGATVWQAASDAASYQSPMLARIDGADRVVVGGDQYLFALDPRTGREVWRYEHGGRGFFAKIINPVVLGPDALFLTYRPDESILLRTSGTPAVGWSTRDLKLNYATPVTYDGLVFGYSGTFLSCVDATSGAFRWRSRAPGDGFPIVVDDHLVVLTKEGRLSVAAASAAGYVEQASLDVFDRLVWTPPSFAGGRIYARDSYDRIAAIDIVPASRTTDLPAPGAGAGMLPGSRFARWVEEVERSGDRGAAISTWLDAQASFPVIEGDSAVHIVYRGQATDLVVVGDMLETGQSLPMHRVANTDFYYASFAVAPDARLAYQFIRNLGQAEPDPRNPVRATSLNYGGAASVLLMPKAAALPAPPAPLRGRIVDLTVDSPVVTSSSLRWGGPRAVHVYLPPGYDASARRYPAVYVLYGAQMLTEGRLDAAIDREIGSTLAPMIAVFVESTNAYEYARTFREAHLRMLETQIVPLIDSRFRTLADPRQRVILGPDEGGFAAVETALRLPQVFGGAIAHSLFPLSKGGEQLLALVDRATATTQRFHVDWGRYDPHRQSDLLDVAGFSRALHARLAARGYTVTGGESPDGSLLPFWTERSIAGLRALFPGDASGGRQTPGNRVSPQPAAVRH